jgi:hypothetical protein
MESSDNERGPGWVLYSGRGTASGGRLLGVTALVASTRNFYT